ncbi:hypothetical protein LOD99_11015 [Oopsacas minuta]|uniref:Uncharacterized protein n=1 Tax=Oopsacas minuta TaxID=111878 RepID=A0AAV7KF16_9METZ|nr:hypothetical protein LOD99_11015 [Oopsacas minuta]
MQPEMRSVEIIKVEVCNEVEIFLCALSEESVNEKFLQTSIYIVVRLFKSVLYNLDYQVEELKVRLTIVCLAIIGKITGAPSPYRFNIFLLLGNLGSYTSRSC